MYPEMSADPGAADTAAPDRTVEGDPQQGDPVMGRATLRIAPSRAGSPDDSTAMSEALGRLYRATVDSVSDIVAELTASERARLAVFCYGRAHLNAIGLAIAATCDLEHLVAASSSATAGQALFTQSRDAAMPVGRTSRRPAITLATAGSGRFASFALDEPTELTA
jgi:hypothetical protein